MSERRPHWDDVTKPLDPEFCRPKAVASGLDCASHDPISGAVCQKPEGHMGAHGGMTKEGSWRNW